MVPIQQEKVDLSDYVADGESLRTRTAAHEVLEHQVITTTNCLFLYERVSRWGRGRVYCVMHVVGDVGRTDFYPDAQRK